MLSGKRALITGAASGIGRAAAARFTTEGAAVALLDRDGPGVLEAAAEIGALGLAADVRLEAEIEAAVAEAVGALGGLDILVANAGVQLHGEDDRADRLALAVWERTLRINLTGVFLTCKHGIRALIDAGGGSVVCTSSPTAFSGVAPGYDAYSASKAGVLGLVRAMARDYAPDVRVNAVVPGFVETALVAPVTRDAEWLANVLATVPLGRAGRPDEVAGLIAFVASDACAYATGAAFVLDGGMTG
ncbi:MAG TPA: SDR family NAD(P)-dependent oxidoreductase [Gaiellaceae bacterium]|nr:SDR family NAD(P)-dependent oxidoreductase [Gaiellaceae bacterium]